MTDLCRRASGAQQKCLRYTTPSMCLDLNTIGDICYVLDIRIDRLHRGKGWGDLLYRLAENIARREGCRIIRMYPSGSTATGESRKSYLLRRGYREFKAEVEKSLEQPP